MPKILVAEDVPDLRFLVTEVLMDAGYEVIQASDGAAALEMARREVPDALIMDVWMPVMDGFEVVGKLRGDPVTRDIPVLMLTSLSPQEGEKLGMEMGVAHYLTKPVDHRVLIITLRVVLREREFVARPSAQKHSPIKTANKFIALEQRLGGGLAPETLTLLEGASASGKSVLCQHLVFGALEGGVSTAYITSQHSRESLVMQMNSLGLNVQGHLHGDRLKVLRTPEARERERAEPLLEGLAQTMEELPPSCKFVVVDSIPGLASSGTESAVMEFFSACRRMCNKGRTVVVAVHSHALSVDMLSGLRALSDTYIRTRSEALGGRLMKTVEVRKANSSNLEENNMVSFEVVPNTGIRVLPISRARA